MRIALIDSRKKIETYSSALLKIGSWRKSLGDKCKLYVKKLPPKGKFDEIWISTCFTFELPFARGLVRKAKELAPVVRVGGIAATLIPGFFDDDNVEVHRGLIPEAESFQPDYSLLEELPTFKFYSGHHKYTITHTSRGCVRKCGFCMVRILEPEFQERNWIKDIHPDARAILFYDNNWLAKDIKLLKKDVKLIRKLHESGQIKTVDFNQALDCRLMTEEKADLLAGLPISPVRFAFDSMAADGYYQKAIRMMHDRGFYEFVALVLYNYHDTPKDFYYRLRVAAEMSEELGANVKSFPMPYQSIMDVDKGRKYVGRYWTPQKKKSFQFIKACHSGPSGTVSTVSTQHELSPIAEFEYWFGKNENEFVKLLEYPKIRALMNRKKGSLRMRRAKSMRKKKK